jgi:hypothetical protein
LDDCSAQVFPYNVFAYCSICRVDYKFARNKKKCFGLTRPSNMAATKTTQIFWLAHGWQHHIGKNWHKRAPASGEYTITPEDGRVRLKDVDE